MMKKIFGFMLCFSLLFLGSMAYAAHITVILSEFSSPYHNIGTYYDEYTVGTFSYDLNGETIVSASISGKWGNSLNSTTAHNLLFADAIQVADSRLASPDPTSHYDVPWSYTFSSFSDLNDGNVIFKTIQLAHHVVRLGDTTLEIDTRAVPLPPTLLLLGSGLAWLAGFGRKFKR